jgi:hypothetical protein
VRRNKGSTTAETSTSYAGFRSAQLISTMYKQTPA